MPTTTIEVEAILFDMDGTLVDSTQGVVGAWKTFARTYPGLDVHRILSRKSPLRIRPAHGVRTVENLQKYCGIDDPVIQEQEAERFEQAIVDCSVRSDGAQGIVLLPGVREVMDAIAPARHLPAPRWAICTSATHKYASQALAIAGVPVPDVFVCAENVAQGKPAPDPYLLGAEKCGVKPERCIVFEDAPNGVKSGQAAGCLTLAVVTSHTRAQMKACKPTYLVHNLSNVSAELIPGGIRLTIEESD